MKITPRQAEPLDRDAILALDESRFDPSLPPHTGDWLGPDRAAWIDKWIAAGECFIAEAEGQAVGYGVFHYHFFHDGMIDMLIVGGPYRRRGVGRALVRHFVGICQSEKIWSSTNLSNHPMQALLAAEGFKMSGFVDNLDDGDPELIYFKRAQVASA